MHFLPGNFIVKLRVDLISQESCVYHALYFVICHITNRYLYFFQHFWSLTRCGVSGEVQGFGKEEFTTFLKSVKAGKMLEKMSSIIMKKEVENVTRYDAASIQSLQIQPLLTFLPQTFYLII